MRHHIKDLGVAASKACAVAFLHTNCIGYQRKIAGIISMGRAL
jgi:hypothetical protein